MSKDISTLCSRFEELFSLSPTVYASAPGRTVLGGNHTDHQHGRALAAAVDLRAQCVAAPNGGREICVWSEGHKPCVLNADELAPREEERDHSVSLVRGIAAQLNARGIEVGGFYAYTTNAIPSGGGLSSSAAFEVMIAAVMSELFGGGMLDAPELALIGKRAENIYYGKPCGLMDQTACAIGGAVAIDFAIPEMPEVTRLDFSPAAHGYALVIAHCGAGHADLTDDYASIPREMAAVARYMGAEVLHEVEEDVFYAALPDLRKALGDRAVLRAMHYFEEDKRAALETEALVRDDFDEFLRLVNASGRSSWMYLQNICPAGAITEQPMALTLALCDRLLNGRGAFRVHGGGFAGTVQAYVPTDMLEDFRTRLEALNGPGSCRVMQAGVRGCFVEKI